MEQRYTELEVEDYEMISYNMDNNWKYIVEDNINDKGGVVH